MCVYVCARVSVFFSCRRVPAVGYDWAALSVLSSVQLLVRTCVVWGMWEYVWGMWEYACVCWRSFHGALVLFPVLRALCRWGACSVVSLGAFPAVNRHAVGKGPVGCVQDAATAARTFPGLMCAVLPVQLFIRSWSSLTLGARQPSGHLAAPALAWRSTPRPVWGAAAPRATARWPSRLVWYPPLPLAGRRPPRARRWGLAGAPSPPPLPCLRAVPPSPSRRRAPTHPLPHPPPACRHVRFWAAPGSSAADDWWSRR